MDKYYDNASREDFSYESYDDEYRRKVRENVSNERRVNKSEIRRKQLAKKHEMQLKKAGLRGFLAGAGLVAAISFGAPRFMGGEELANEMYKIVTDAGYGWKDYTSGLQFNHGTTYVSYDDAMSDITYMCHAAGYSDAEIDVAFKKIFGINPRNSTFEERDDAKMAKYHQTKAEEKGMGR